MQQEVSLRIGIGKKVAIVAEHRSAIAIEKTFYSRNRLSHSVVIKRLATITKLYNAHQGDIPQLEPGHDGWVFGFWWKRNCKFRGDRPKHSFITHSQISHHPNRL